MITFPIVNQRKSCSLHHFRSLMLWKSIIHRSARGNPVGTEVVLSEKYGPDFRPSGGSGRPPTPSPPHAPTPAHPHTRSCTRIDFNTPRFSSFGKNLCVDKITSPPVRPSGGSGRLPTPVPATCSHTCSPYIRALFPYLKSTIRSFSKRKWAARPHNLHFTSLKSTNDRF